jgi:hypothetical protein
MGVANYRGMPTILAFTSEYEGQISYFPPVRNHVARNSTAFHALVQWITAKFTVYVEIKNFDRDSVVASVFESRHASRSSPTLFQACFMCQKALQPT